MWNIKFYLCKIFQREVKNMDFENLDELKALKARGVLSEEQFEQYKNLAARKILRDRKDAIRSRNAFIYMALAYFTGTLGLHNFYSGESEKLFTVSITKNIILRFWVLIRILSCVNAIRRMFSRCSAHPADSAGWRSGYRLRPLAPIHA